jgi:WD40 repeat protein
MKILSQYLSVLERPEGDLASVADKQIEGSCQWINNSLDFIDWHESSDFSLVLFWLSGKPATGKSVAAGHVIKHLEQCNRDCSYYFFKRGDIERSRISEMLRSLAYQMAFMNLRIQQELLSMQSEGESFDKDDERMIWRKIFLTRIFRTEVRKPHFWVVDALDECRDYSSLFQMLSKVEKKFPLRVFVTSRSSDSIERLFAQEKTPVYTERITTENSLNDIRLFLEANTHFLPADSEAACQELIDQILSKSNGCFLWAALVLKELETAHSDEQIREILKDVPTEMDELYDHILDGMAEVPRNKRLTKAILRWTVCAARPLTTEELKEALRLDIGETLPRLDKTVGSVCGNLVHVDSQSRVQVIHLTVTAFLVREELESEFAINRATEHSRLAEICLKYLLSDEMKSLRRYRKGLAQRPVKRSLFAEYATQYFSEHISQSSSSVNNQLILLDKFFKTNVLTWVELIARGENIYFLYQSAKNLKAYLKRQTKYRSPLGKEIQAVEAWSDDLIHIIAAFGKCLLSSPTSIHFLIPPVCPPGSILHKSFKDYPRNIDVVGISGQDWDDRLSCITFPEDQALSIACRDSRFAVGLSSGIIVLYEDTTCQESGALNHGEPVRFLEFANINPFLASSSGRRIVKLWNAITETLIWTVDIHVVPLSLSFNEDDSILMAATTSNHVERWNVPDGSALDIRPFWDPEDEQAGYKRPPWQAQFSSELNILAIGYRQRPITLWDLEDNSFLGQLSKSTTSLPLEPRIATLVLNPNPEINLLAVSYQDGELVTYDPWSQLQQASVNASAQILAASPDGKTLATENGCGTIQLYDFETLKLIYSITTEDHYIRALAFASNGLRFFNIGGSYCNIWEPSALVRRVEPEDNYSEPCSGDAPNIAQVASSKLWDDSLTITAIVDHHYGDFVFCGRENGSVVVFDTKTGKLMQELYRQTKDIAVSLLEWNHQESMLASTDASGRFTARKVTREISGLCRVSEPLIDGWVDQAVRQILLSPNGKQLLVSTTLAEYLYSIEEEPIQHLSRVDSTARQMSKKWTNHPSDQAHLLQFDGLVARIFSWSSLEELSAANGISLGVDDVELPLTELLSSSQGQSVCARFSAPRSRRGSSQLRLWTASRLHPKTDSVSSRANYVQLAAEIKAVVGIYKALLLFLDHNGWVCSVGIEGSGVEKSYTRHFFIPYGWHSGGDLIFRCTSKGAVVLARRDEIAVFHRGLDFEEKVVLE